MSKENPSFARKTEVVAEKVGGGLFVVLGAISLSAPAVAIGLGLYFVGKVREPKQKIQTA